MLYYLKHIIIVISSVFATHFIAYILVKYLPAAAEIMLGIYSTHEDALESLRQLTIPRTYKEIFFGIFLLDFGNSVDGVPVGSEMFHNLKTSAPRIVISLFFIVFATILSSSLARRNYYKEPLLLSFILFVPSYGIAFMIFGLLLLSPLRLDTGSFETWIACAISIAIPPSSLLAYQAYGIMSKCVSSQYAQNLLYLGVSEKRVRMLLYRNLIYEITPSFEKVITGIIMSLMFSEMIFGLPGIGTLAIRAIRRSDVELLLGIVFLFALFIALSRILALLILGFYKTK